MMLYLVYLLYAVIGVGLVMWLARTLFQNGEVFLGDVFPERPDLARAVNRLLVVGFYLINLGFAAKLMVGLRYMENPADGIDMLAARLGTLLITLAIMHFINLFIFHRIRRRAALTPRTAPVAPVAFTVPAGGHGQGAPAR